MEYKTKIIDCLLDIYEKRGYYKKSISDMKAISIKTATLFSAYSDNYDHVSHNIINSDIAELIDTCIIESKKNNHGSYDKITLNVKKVSDAYLLAGRTPLADKYADLINVLNKYSESEHSIMNTIISEFYDSIEKGNMIGYGIKYDALRLESILNVLAFIFGLEHETYVRNLSIALFKDSKEFQNNFKNCIQSILYDHTETSVDKKRILEVYNVYENPTYVLMKGKATIITPNSSLCLDDMTGGVAIPESALQDIKELIISSSRVITVENLTTFHDCDSNSDLFIYLGGFHNKSKETFLKLLYRCNPQIKFYHMGDLDVYGFAILESLKTRTGIPFEPMNMDIDTLEKYYKAGLYKPLDEYDKKAMMSPNLQKYHDVFEFMKNHNCKVEQESIKAIELLQ